MAHEEVRAGTDGDGDDVRGEIVQPDEADERRGHRDVPRDGDDAGGQVEARQTSDDSLAAMSRSDQVHDECQKKL